MEKDLPSWPRLAIAVALVVGLGVGVAGTAVVVGMADGERPQVVEPGGISLVAYDSCDSALSELKAAALPNVGPFGWGGGDYGEGDVASGGGVVPDGEMQAEGAAPREGDAAASAQDKAAAPEPAPGHSGTNNYESDVDEPDIVKTDGRRVVSIVDGQLRVVDAASHKQTARLALPSGYATQLLISGDRALVLTSSGVAMPTPREGGIVPEPVPVEPDPGGKPAEPGASPPIDTPPVDPAFGSQLVLVDLTGAGEVLGTLAVEGSYLDARQVGAVARVVVRSTPRLKFTYPDVGRTPDDAEEQNHGIVESSSISDWLPRYQLAAGGHLSSGELVDCTAVSHPEQYTGSGLLTVLTVDLRRQLGTGTPISIAADGNTVYGTGTNLYVADDHFAHGGGPTERPAPDGGQRTEIYQFDISGSGKPRHVASGGVEGGLLNQYSLSEHEGHLRVATTVGGMEAESHSMVSVLTRRGDELAEVGRVDGLGKGERIYSVRYLGDTAYVVTFRQTDPLYTVDLSEPSRPRVTGELKITGYSAYLHPVGDGRLLGVGQEATVQGSTTGTQVSLFDTSNQRGAKRLSQVHFEGGHSEVEGDPHAFLYWPEKNLVVLPMAVMSDPAAPGTGAVVLKVSGDTLTQVGTLRHEGAVGFAPRRALVIGDELWTVSQAGMLVSDLDRLTQVAWLPFT